MTAPIGALATAIIYFGSFLAVGFVARRAIDKWMNRRDIDLAGIQAQAGPNRGKRRIFLLGFWRDEGPD
jgi:hypothetical protein